MKYIVYTALATIMGLAVVVIDSRSVEFDPSTARVPLNNRIFASGIVEGATEDIQLRTEIIGRVKEVLVRVGDRVQQGDILLRLDSRRQQQQVAASKAHLELAQAQLERLVNGARPEERAEARALLEAKQARLRQEHLTWERVQQLRKQAAVSQQEYDNQQGLVDTLTAEVAATQAQLEQLEAPARTDELRVAQARVAAAEADFELAQIALDKTTLRAPHQGQVLDVNVEPGELLGSEDPTPAVVLSDTTTLRIRAFVEEIDAPRLEKGMPAKVTADGLPNETFHGRVTSLSPRMAPKRVSSGSPDELYDTKVREVLVTLANADKLLVGLRVDVVFNE